MNLELSASQEIVAGFLGWLVFIKFALQAEALA